jgi:diacylglycerol kinase (ATP)
VSNTLYIINPAGRGGTGTKAWEEFKTLWSDRIDPKHTIVTERPGHAREIAASAEGYDIFVAVSGDGTAGEIMSGIMERQGPRPKLAVIPAGTGNDIARNVGICSVADGAGALRNGRARAFDLVRIDCQVDGQPAHRHAFLYGSAGFSPIYLVRPWMKRLLGPKGAYYLGMFLQIIVFRAPQMTVRAEGREHSGRNWMIMVANAERSAGGSMCIGPGARLDDGELNVTVVPSNSKFTVITRLLPKVATGAHVNEPGMSYFPGKRIEIDSDPPAIVELDGDIFGATPATFTVCPRKMQIMTRELPDEKAV